MNARLLIALGILGAIIVGIGEWMLHFAPSAPAGEIAMLEHVPLARASVGHFLVVFGAPLYIAGYFGLLKVFVSSSPWLARGLFTCGVLAFMVGGVWVGSRYFGAEVLQRSAETADYEFYLASYEQHYQVLVNALRVFVLGVTGFYVGCVLKNQIGMPRWLAVLNPIVVLILIFTTLIWAKPIGQHVAIVAMNPTHVVFFGIVLLFAKSR